MVDRNNILEVCEGARTPASPEKKTAPLRQVKNECAPLLFQNLRKNWQNNVKITASGDKLFLWKKVKNLKIINSSERLYCRIYSRIVYFTLFLYIVLFIVYSIMVYSVLFLDIYFKYQWQRHIISKN